MFSVLKYTIIYKTKEVALHSILLDTLGLESYKVAVSVPPKEEMPHIKRNRFANWKRTKKEFFLYPIFIYRCILAVYLT